VFFDVSAESRPAVDLATQVEFEQRHLCLEMRQIPRAVRHQM